MNYPKAILFDLDDTLISFNGVADEAWDKCCTEFLMKYQLSLTKNKLITTLKNARGWYWGDPDRHKTGRENIKQARRGIVKLALKEYDITETNMIYYLADNYTELQYKMVHIYPNTKRTLDTLKSGNIRLGLITNGTSQGQRAKLERFELADYFEIILIDQELGFGKPDPEVYCHALDLLRLPSQDVWMVGDNLVWDIQAPQSVGIYSIWHDYQRKGLKNGSQIIPDRIINEISQLIE